MTSCSTSSLLFCRGRKDRWVLGRCTGLNDGLEILEPVSLELSSSISEVWCEAEMDGLQILSVALGTGLRVTRIKVWANYGSNASDSERLTKIKCTVWDANLTLCKLTGSDDIGTSWQSIIRIYNEGFSRRFHTNKPRRVDGVIWVRFTHPVKKLGKEIPELLIEFQVCVIRAKFKPTRPFHHTKSRLLHTGKCNGGDVNIILETIYWMEWCEAFLCCYILGNCIN